MSKEVVTQESAPEDAAPQNLMKQAEDTSANESSQQTAAEQDAKPEESKPEESKPEESNKAEVKNLLDGEQPVEKKEDAAAPTEEEVSAWIKDVPALDLGDGVKWDDAALKAMAPSLMGLKKEESGKVIQAYADWTKAQAKAQAEAADAFNAGQIKACQERFGADLKKVAGLAKRGGEHLFAKHPEVWKALKSTPAFANNPDVMECLAEAGRMYAEDTGRVVPKDGTGDRESADVLHRMYGSVKV